MRIQFFILTFLMCLIGTNVSIAQESSRFSLDMLKDKEWTIAGYEKADYSTKIVYNQEEAITTFTYQEKQHSTKDAFYLSDTPDKEFNRKKIGSTSGKYLIQQTQNRVIVFEILKLTHDSMSLKNLGNKVTVNYFVE